MTDNDNLVANKFAEARDIMSDTFAGDAELRDVYRANIAMLIYDNQTREPYHLGNGEVVDQPLDLSHIEHCDAMAERLIRLIFDS